MRHKLSGAKLNRTSTHRQSMLANMAVALIQHEQIQTTVPKAKTLRPYIEKLITISKKNDLSAKRRVIAELSDEQAVRKLFSIINARYSDRPGGYTRIIKNGNRHGDYAPIAYIELVDRDIVAKGQNFASQIPK
jgi:large subunit ribosomal protein L17